MTSPRATPRHRPGQGAEIWIARLLWLGLAAQPVFAGGLDDRSTPVQITAAIVLWVAWASVALALLVPSTVSLTHVRVMAPAAVVAVVLAVVAAGSDGAVEPWEAALGLANALLAALAVHRASFGELMVQASAYGDERRFPLRPPAAYVLPVVISWCALVALAFTGALALAARGWLPGIAATTAAVGLAWVSIPRYHRLSRRWFVMVPAGIVVHDHLVLAETAMFPKRALAGIRLALAGTGAADLSGPAAGHLVEVELREMSTIVLARSRAKPEGSAIHAAALLIAPSRPGRALRTAQERGLPVGAATIAPPST